MTREGAGWRLYRDTVRSQAHDTGGARGACAGHARGAQAAWAGGWALGRWAERAQARRALGRRAQACGALGRASAAAVAGRARQAGTGHGLGVLLGQQAVHLMHLACFLKFN